MFKDEFEEFRARADSGGFLGLCRPRFKHQDRLSDIQDSDEDLGNPPPPGAQLASSWPRVGLLTRARAYATTPLALYGTGGDGGEGDGEDGDGDKDGDEEDTQLTQDDNSDTCCTCIAPSHRGKSRPVGSGEGANMRPRLASMPSPSLRRVVSPKRPSLGQLRVRASGKQDEWRERIRCFKITSKGLVRERDCYVTPPVSPPGDGSGETKCLLANIGRNNVDAATRENDDDCAVCQPQYTIVVVGSKGVGKTHIIRQFQTPVNHANISCSFDDETETSVTILLDGEEATLQFINIPETKEIARFAETSHTDAFVVVYSVEDRSSYVTAVERLDEIRHEEDRQVAVILVANKSDLVRSRVVMEVEGKSSAKSYDCKYIEVSAAIDHQIDELLVGILKQIRLLRAQHLRPFPGDRKRSGEPRADRKSSDPKARFDVLRLLRRNKPKSCKNLYVL